VTTFPTTYASSDVSDTGMVLRGLPLNGGQPVQHLNGSVNELPSGGRPLPTSTPPAQAKPNDPLAGMTPWQIYQKCIWVSDEDAYVKIMLLCISRYMGKDLHAASMAYSQIARDCGFSQETAKKCAKRVAGTWLKIGVQKGRYVPGKGNQNLYDGIIPEKWASEVRQRILGGDTIEPDKEIANAVDNAIANKTGVSNRHPDGQFRGAPEAGVSEGHPETGVSDRPGCLTDTTGVSESPPYFRYTDKKKTLLGADAPGARATDLFAEGAPTQDGVPSDRAPTPKTDPHCKPSSSKRSKPVEPTASPEEVEVARAAYNVAAEAHKFTRCEILAPKVRERLARRLVEIGQSSNMDRVIAFQRALDALPLWPFLLGKLEPTKPGQPRFRLDIERLLQTDGGLGDVLIKLLNLAASRANSPTPAKPKPIPRY
jgi:hypothetical protein